MKKSTPATVAITGMNALPENPAAGVPVARCLREAFGNKIRIVGLGYDAFDAGLYINNYCDAAYLLPYPRVGSEALFLRLNEIQRIEKIDALIPCLDAELAVLIGITEKLLHLGIRTFLPKIDALLRCYKDRLPELAKIIGLNYPEVKVLYSSDFFNHCHLEGWIFPLVVKGPFYDARIVSTPAEAKEAFRIIANDWGVPILAQRFSQGEECNLTAIGDGAGKMIGEVMMKKVALTSKHKACVGVTTHDQILINAAKKMVNELQWKGPFELEVMYDPSGIYHLIEINPRFPAWISLSQGVGRNLPALLLELMLGQKMSPLAPPSVGTYFIRYAQEQIVSLKQIESMVTRGSSVLTSKE